MTVLLWLNGTPYCAACSAQAFVAMPEMSWCNGTTAGDLLASLLLCITDSPWPQGQDITT